MPESGKMCFLLIETVGETSRYRAKMMKILLSLFYLTEVISFS